jgi:quinol-cytochrome oxidoreductase complex cytochrome b subunit
MANVAEVLKNAPSHILKFFEERVSKIDLFDETKADLQKESPWYQLGAMYYLAWVVVMITGVLLVAFYLPTTAQAFDSIHALSENSLGHILRGMHKYGGDAMIIAATLRVYRMWFSAEYKNKGEFAFILSIVLLLAAMYSGLTGYLLIWNQRAFWATKVFATFPTFLDITPGNWHWPLPYDDKGNFNLMNLFVNGKTWFIPNIIGAATKIIGNVTHQGMSTSQILTGGSSIGQATITRFFSLHFGISLFMHVHTVL